MLFFLSRKHKNILIPTSAHVYQLDQNIIFDADLKKLIVGKEEILMKPQISVLLRHFLEAPEFILKDEEIQEIFWSNKSNNESRLHNAISRLRGVFENIPSIEVQRYEKVGYQLYIRRI